MESLEFGQRPVDNNIKLYTANEAANLDTDMDPGTETRAREVGESSHATFLMPGRETRLTMA